MSLYCLSASIFAAVFRLLSPFPAGRPADRLSTSGLARDARGAVFALLASSGGALRLDTGPKETDRCIGLTPLSTAASGLRAAEIPGPHWWEWGWPQPRVGPRAHPCHPAVPHAAKRQRAGFAGAARSPRGRCPVGAAAAVAPACGELTAGSVAAVASRMLLAPAATEYGAPASSPGGHVQGSPGWKRASVGCSPRAGRRCPSRWSPARALHGKKTPTGRRQPQVGAAKIRAPFNAHLSMADGCV